MTIYYVYWARINWDARYTYGYNDVIENGAYFAISEELAKEMCPITAEEGDIKITPITVYTKKP